MLLVYTHIPSFWISIMKMHILLLVICYEIWVCHLSLLYSLHYTNTMVTVLMQ